MVREPPAAKPFRAAADMASAAKFWDENGNTVGTSTIPLAPDSKTEATLRTLPGLSGMVGLRGSAQFRSAPGAGRLRAGHDMAGCATWCHVCARRSASVNRRPQANVPVVSGAILNLNVDPPVHHERSPLPVFELHGGLDVPSVSLRPHNP